MPEPSHGRSKSHWDVSPRSSPTKSTPIRSSSPLFRFVRSSSPTFTSQSSGASASPSPTKSLHRYTHAPTFVQRFFSSTTQLDDSSLEIPLTEHERGPRQRATSDLSKTSPDSRQILALGSKLPVNLRNRRRSASLPSPGNLPHLVVSQPSTPASARPKKHLVGVPRESPISMYSVQDDPFRYSAGPAGLSVSPAPSPSPSPTPWARRMGLPNESSPSSTTILEKTDSPGRARAKSSPNLLIPLQYGSRDSTAPLKLPKRSQSGKVEKPRSSSRQNNPTPSPSSAFPTHLSFQRASPTTSLRTAVALPGRKSSREIQPPARKVLAPLDPSAPGKATNMTFPLLEAETSTRRIVASAAPPIHQAGTQDSGLSRHVRPMLSRSSSDAKSFDIIARYNSNSANSNPTRRTPDSTSTTSFLDLSPGSQKPQATPIAQPSPRPVPRSAAAVSGRSANSKGPRPKLHPGLFDAKEDVVDGGGSPGRLILDHSVYSEQRGARPALPTSLSDESFGNTTFDTSTEGEETAGDPASDRMSTSSSATSLGSPILDTTLLKDIRNVKERGDDSAPWLSVTPPSPVKDPSKRRGFIYRSSLMPPPYVPRSPSPEPEVTKGGAGTSEDEEGKDRQVDDEDVTILPAESDDEVRPHVLAEDSCMKLITVFPRTLTPQFQRHSNATLTLPTAVQAQSNPTQCHRPRQTTNPTPPVPQQQISPSPPLAASQPQPHQNNSSQHQH